MQSVIFPPTEPKLGQEDKSQKIQVCLRFGMGLMLDTFK